MPPQKQYAATYGCRQQMGAVKRITQRICDNYVADVTQHDSRSRCHIQRTFAVVHTHMLLLPLISLGLSPNPPLHKCAVCTPRHNDPSHVFPYPQVSLNALNIVCKSNANHWGLSQVPRPLRLLHPLVPDLLFPFMFSSRNAVRCTGFTQAHASPAQPDAA